MPRSRPASWCCAGQADRIAIRYITPPQVVVDATVPVERWRLSEHGRARATALLAQPWVPAIGRVVSSGETKALELARMLAHHLGLGVEVRERTGEIDRSAAGFLPPDEFERVADACFADPGASARGWERAVDAQARMVDALADLLVDDDGDGDGGVRGRRPDIAVIGHGGVGTFWYCHLAGVPIERRWDQTRQGHYITVVDGRPVHPWRPIDAGLDPTDPRFSNCGPMCARERAHWSTVADFDARSEVLGPR